MIAAVVVTHSAPVELLDRCVAALDGDVDRVVVVDTGGRSGRDWSPPESVEVVAVENRGYGAAANAGIGAVRDPGVETVVLLNDDAVVRPGAIAALAAALRDDDGLGAVQPVLVRADSSPPIIDSCGVAIGPDGAGTDVGDGELHVPGTGVEDIELFTGGAVALRPEFVAATGGFDERWFLYYEDVDLGRRGARLGWRYALVRDAVVEHAGGATTGATPDRTRHLQERNRLWCAVRHADLRTVAGALWLSVRRLRHPPRGVHLRALLAGIAGIPGVLRRRWSERRALGSAG